MYELKTATDTQVSSQVKLRYNKVNNALNLPTALFLFLRRNKINFKIEFTFVSGTSDLALLACEKNFLQEAEIKQQSTLKFVSKAH